MKISGIGNTICKSLFNKTKFGTKSIKNVPVEEMFCNKIWAKAVDDRLVRQTSKESVSLHGSLNGINHHFIRSAHPEDLDNVFMNLNITPREMIRKTDIEFKRLKPTTETMNVTRCIGEKPEFFSEYPLYLKRTQVKKGDIIDMKEYAYATPDISYAKVYLHNNKGLLYDIEIPAGARVSRSGNEVVFPRSSRFECIDVKTVKDANNDYKHIKLKYILPNEPWRAK